MGKRSVAPAARSTDHFKKRMSGPPETAIVEALLGLKLDRLIEIGSYLLKRWS